MAFKFADDTDDMSLDKLQVLMFRLHQQNQKSAVMSLEDMMVCCIRISISSACCFIVRVTIISPCGCPKQLIEE